MTSVDHRDDHPNTQRHKLACPDCASGQPSKVANTIAYLRACQELRAALGYSPTCTRDPEWLVDMAINRRAGWPEDPWARDCAQPVDGRLPRFAHGDAQRHLLLIAHTVNSSSPRIVIRPQALGEWRRYLMNRIPERFTTEEP